MILLDTNVISELMKETPDVKVLGKRSRRL